MSDTMEGAIEVLAMLLAKKAAKANDTTSEKWIEGYAKAVVFCAKNPLPSEADQIAALDEAIAKLPEKPAPKLVEGEG